MKSRPQQCGIALPAQSNKIRFRPDRPGKFWQVTVAVEETQDLEDLKNVNLAKSGDLKGFDALVMYHQGMVSGLLFRFAGQPADLEDLVQETFIRAFKNHHRWQSHRPFSHWLKRIAVNVGRDYYRRKKSAAKWFTESGPEDIESFQSQSADSEKLSCTQEAQWLLAKLQRILENHGYKFS